MDLNKKLIGSRIRQMRLDNGWTQEELAKLLGLNGKSHISNYESGRNIPKDGTKLKMCDLFNCSVNYLMGLSTHKIF